MAIQSESHLSRSVGVAPMLHTVDYNDALVFVDLVDDSVVTASGGVEALEFSD